MNWTRKAPTVAGWYWWRRDQHALPGVAIACSDLSGYYMNRTGHNSTFDHVDDVIGEWLGPLTPDSYRQGRVDSLEKQVEELEMEIKRRVWLSHGSRMKHLLYGDDGKMDCNSCGRDYAAMPLEVAQRYELDDAIKLAQQAQKEKGVMDAEN